MSKSTSVLILGASGMLGHTLLRYFAESPGFSVTGSVRSAASLEGLPDALHGRIVSGIDVTDNARLEQLVEQARPDVVVNCVGLVKQLPEADDPVCAISINSLLPHRLLRLCKSVKARLVHVSTDCVFDGTRGMYRETDVSDADDLYGRSKYLGELHDAQAITLRTSIIGPELGSAHGLIAWFLAQQTPTKGFTKAIFSGLPTVEFARVLRDVVIPRKNLGGLYHLSAAPISKYDLLSLVAREYSKSIELVPDGGVVIDRSLDSSRFRAQTLYVPPTWPQLVHAMRAFG